MHVRPTRCAMALHTTMSPPAHRIARLNLVRPSGRSAAQRRGDQHRIQCQAMKAGGRRIDDAKGLVLRRANALFSGFC
jgi:hypothetical protein